MEKSIQITMLGKFTIYGPGLPRPRLISLTGRSRRLWILVAYLILNRERGVPAQELIHWLWPDAEGINSLSTLQNNISRARNALEELGLEDGKRLIANTSGTYFWAPDRETELDCERFERLAAQALDCREAARACTLAAEAERAYTGDFLPDCQEEPWFRQRAEEYRTLYRKLCTTATRRMLDAGQYGQADEFCTAAMGKDPLNQDLGVAWMQALRLVGRPDAALTQGDALCSRLQAAGRTASAELEMERASAQSALLGTPDENTRLLHSLVRDEQEQGAMLCDSAVFQEFVRRQLRVLRRGGEAQLLSFRMAAEAENPKVRSDSMNRMEQALLHSLRGADPVARGGVDLFLVLLPGASRENGESVARRILSRYEKDLPSSCEKFLYQIMDLNGDSARG